MQQRETDSTGHSPDKHSPAPPSPPVARPQPKVDTIHGEHRQDEYYWLREKDNPEVREYIEAENAYAEAMLEHTRPLQEELYREFVSRVKQTDSSVPYRRRGYYYYTRFEEGKQHPIYCRKKGSMEAPEEVMLDVNMLGEGGFVSVEHRSISDDDRYLAYGLDTTGFRQFVLRVKDLETGELLADRIERCTSVTWGADNQTIFYTVENDAKRSYRLYRHRMGSGVHTLIYEETDEMFRLWVRRSHRRDMIILSSSSLTTSEQHVIDAADIEGEWRVIVPRRHEIQYWAEPHGDRYYIRVNDTGRHYRLVSAPIADPRTENWEEIVPHREEVMLDDFDLFADYRVLYERWNGLMKFDVTSLVDGENYHIEFPDPVYEAYPLDNHEWETQTLRFGYQSLVLPSSVFDFDMRTRERTLMKQVEVLGEYDPSLYRSERILVPAEDGTEIPVSLVYRADTPLDGTAPMLLRAYGAYGSSTPAAFSIVRISLLDRGLVVAQAHVRGGGDLGKKWHDAGRMFNKMNTFTDFIACAEGLIERKYTSSDRLAIEGGSAGGLLMGAVANLRPDLWRVIISHVPFVDVINTMLDTNLPLTVGEFEEWGNPAIKEEYEYIKQYCPYTNLRRGAYPAMIIRTAFHDSQVMYWEPAKYVARLRTLKTDQNPLLLITDMAAGHGGASGRYDQLRESALYYAFMLEQVEDREARTENGGGIEDREARTENGG